MSATQTRTVTGDGHLPHSPDSAYRRTCTPQQKREKFGVSSEKSSEKVRRKVRRKFGEKFGENENETARGTLEIATAFPAAGRNQRISQRP